MHYEEVQNNEVEALKAIYGSDFRELPVQSVWNQRPAPKFEVSLRPSSDFKDSPIELTIQVQMTQTYPLTKPNITIVRSNALSGRQIEILKQSISSTVREMLKNEMIFEVTSNLQNHIDDWARSVSEAAPSLEEDRLRRLQIEEARQAQRQDELQRQRELAARKEEEKYDTLVLQEIQRNRSEEKRKDGERDLSFERKLLVLPVETPFVCTFDSIIEIQPPFLNAPVRFRQVMLGIRVMGPHVGTTYVARVLLPPSAGTEDTDLAVSLTKISIRAPYWRTPEGTRALHELNTELESMKELQLPGVVPLSEFTIERAGNKEEGWQINLLTPLSRLTPISELLDSMGTIGLKTVQTWALQILESLGGLHKRGIRHKMVCTYNVVIKSDPATGETSVFLRNPQYLYTILQLNEANPFVISDSNVKIEEAKTGSRPRRWSESSVKRERFAGDVFMFLPPESRKRDAAPSSKWDMWQLGMLMVLMVAGKYEMRRFRYDAEAFLRSRPRHIPAVFTKFVLRLLNADPAKRPGALELLTDEFFRTDLDFELDEGDELLVNSNENSIEETRSVSVDAGVLSASTAATNPAAATAGAAISAAGNYPPNGNLGDHNAASNSFYAQIPRSSSAVTLRSDNQFTGAHRRLLSNHTLFTERGMPLGAALQALPTEGNPLGSTGRRRLSSNEEFAYSRYKHDFDEGIVLGKGGFGQVVKARNKLDGRVYAVKKIRATASTLSHILQEVVLLSRLNHQYVVRYYTVWLEDEADSSGASEYDVGNPLSVSSSSSAVVEFDSVSKSTVSELNSANSVGDAIPSTSLSQYSGTRSLTELDFPSVSQDFMSDSGFVEFAFSDSAANEEAVIDDEEDESEDEEEEEEEEDESENSEITVSPPPQPRHRYSVTPLEVELKRREKRLSSERLANLTRKTLYIQMEYCENHTLGDLVRQGLYKDPKEYWRLLRQILDALSYIHGEGVIHRDLKPKNIFIDQARNIKIGDFGLARSMVQPIQSRQPSVDVMFNTGTPNIASSNLHTTVSASDYEEFTTDVGTSLYAAVEITGPNAHSKRGYNEKVDIFSLGIIFFEMVWRMDTEMERIIDIKRARMPQIELPPELVAMKSKSIEVGLIRCMLDHDPNRRPSAHGLLKSGRIPVEESDMKVVEALHNMGDQRVVQQILNALFSRPLVSAQQVLYDRVNLVQSGSGVKRARPRPSDHGGCLSMTSVVDTLKAVFRSHGAVDNTLFRSRLFPRSPLYRVPTVVELVDSQGTVLQLPYDLTLPHARRLAEIVPNFRKAFAVDTVFRSRLQHAAQHPSKHLEVDFDIISTSDEESVSAYDEAEAIAVMFDSAKRVLQHAGPSDLIVVVGHHDILSAVLSHCGLSPPQFHAALVLLSSAGNANGGNGGSLSTGRGAASGINGQRSSVSAASMDMLSQFAFRESFVRAETRLARLMPLSQRVRRALARLREVVQTCRKLCAANVDPPILFSPLVHSTASDFFLNGIMFQLVEVRNVQRTAKQYGVGSVLAMGGRYDSLVQSFRNTLLDGRTPLAKAVGFGMSADKLEMMVAKQHGSNGVPARCQVLISSLSDSCLKAQGLDVARVLWSIGVSADIAEGVMSNDDVLTIAEESRVPVVIMIKQAHAMHSQNSLHSAFKPLRVKRLRGAGEGDVDLLYSELVPFIQQEFQIPVKEVTESPLAQQQQPEQGVLAELIGGIAVVAASNLNSQLSSAAASSSPALDQVASISGGQQPHSLGTSSSALSSSASTLKDMGTDAAAGLSNVLVLNDSSKLKGGRKNRWQLEEKSTSARANFIAELSTAPVVALDLRDDVINAILNVHPAAIDEWKRRVVGLSPNQKAYILSVQAKLATESARSPRMILYSLKTESVFVYTY